MNLPIQHPPIKKVKDGIAAAQKAGVAIKINAVVLKGVNDEDPELIRCAHWQVHAA